MSSSTTAPVAPSAASLGKRANDAASRPYLADGEAAIRRSTLARVSTMSRCSRVWVAGDARRRSASIALDNPSKERSSSGAGELNDRVSRCEDPMQSVEATCGLRASPPVLNDAPGPRVMDASTLSSGEIFERPMPHTIAVGAGDDAGRGPWAAPTPAPPRSRRYKCRR
eukprot:scaffold183584_cov28-Tisochrysis_lutea.AAC.7